MIDGVSVGHNKGQQIIDMLNDEIEAGGVATAQQRAWEREEKRRLELAGEADAERRNNELERWIGALEHVLLWSLDHPVRVSFPAMMEPLRDFEPGDLGRPHQPPNPKDFQPKALSAFARLLPGAGGKFQAQWEEGRVTYEQACQRWQQLEQERHQELAKAQEEHQVATAKTHEQHRRVMELEKDFQTGQRAAVELCLTAALESSVYPGGFPNAFKLIYRRREREALVEYEFPRVRDIIPAEASYRYVKVRSVVESKARSAADTQRLYKSVLAQATLRVLHELFTADQHEHVQRIALNGVVDDIDPVDRPTYTAQACVAAHGQRTVPRPRPAAGRPYTGLERAESQLLTCPYRARAHPANSRVRCKRPAVH
jgi:restriction system protein